MAIFGSGAAVDEGGIHGRSYGPPVGADDAGADMRRYFRAADRLGGVSILVSDDKGYQLFELNPGAKIRGVFNSSSTVTIFVGDTPSVGTGAAGQIGAGWPIGPGQSLFFSNGEYIGPLYARAAVGNQNIDVRTIEPFASLY